MQIFAYTESPEFQALLEIEVKDLTGARPIVRTTLDELKSLLDIFQSIEMLIVDLPENIADAMELKEFLLGSKNRIKKALVLGHESGANENIQAFRRIEISEMFHTLKSFYAPAETQKSGWTAIPLCTLIHFQTLPFDLYIRLSDNRFVKRIPAFEEVDKDLISSLETREVKELFCDKKHNREFSMMLINNMINKVDRPYSSIIEKLRANAEVFRTTKEIILNMGLNGRVIEVCESSVEQMCMEVLSESDTFSSYLLTLKNDDSLTFQYKLITLTNYIGTQLIMEMDRGNYHEEVKKFVFASYFCDMTLNPDLLFHRKADDACALSLHEQNEVNFHALKASELVANYKNMPKEVSLIIKQHHGSLSGIGFPVEKSEQLLPLSKILIVSQDLAHAILSDNSTPALEVLRKFLLQNRCKGLQELVNSLETCFQEKFKETA